MADDGDRAAERAARLNDEALDLHRRRVIGPEHRFCMDCGDEIPVQRRQAAPGCLRCLDCQVIAERRV